MRGPNHLTQRAQDAVTGLLLLPLLVSCGDDGSAAPAPDPLPGEVSSASPGGPSDCGGATPPPSESTENTGTLRGHLYGVGGPAPGTARPWTGTITVTGTTGRVVTAGVDGAYEITLPAGRYEIVGHSPQFGGCGYACHPERDRPQDVVAGRTTTVDVYCSMA